jgi:cyclase
MLAFDAGADKVGINSAALERPDLITEIGSRFGAQAVVVAIDVRRGANPPEAAAVYANGGRYSSGHTVLEWAMEAEARGAGEILLTSMDSDGMRNGFDCELTALVSEAIQIPVIASGGAGNVQHFADVFTLGRADAALAASIFHFGISDARRLKQELAKLGLPMRLPC